VSIDGGRKWRKIKETRCETSALVPMQRSSKLVATGGINIGNRAAQCNERSLHKKQ